MAKKHKAHRRADQHPRAKQAPSAEPVSPAEEAAALKSEDQISAEAVAPQPSVVEKWAGNAKLAAPRRPRRRLWWRLAAIVALVVAGELAFSAWSKSKNVPGPQLSLPVITPSPTPDPSKPGTVLGRDATEHFDANRATTVMRANYPGYANAAATGVTKVTFHYRSILPNGEPIVVYGRAYLPERPKNALPVFAFAPGTTGIADKCAASLERPAVANWANYDSHMVAYAIHGYAAVTTDYEGMRDSSRIHHYMVGELEGRALLDAIRALRQLPESKGRLSGDVFLGGYSQGGHAAFWADKVASGYAKDIKPLGVVGFGPVMSVKQTLTDVAQRGANINWFGPNVLTSYRSYYNASYPGVILPAREPTLESEVLAHCIDTDLPYWGHNPAAIYTPEFIQAAQTETFNQVFPDFAAALDSNAVGELPTATAKRINEGDRDNVVLPAQQRAAVPLLCSSSKGPVQYYEYPNTTHYDTMLHSFNDTLAWMRSLAKKEAIGSTCGS